MSIKIGVIVSTTRPTRVGDKVAKWFVDQVKAKPGIEFEIVDLKKENLPFLCEPESPASGKYELESTKRWSEKVSSYDGFVFVTAEYNNAPPAPLKNAIDSVYNEWDKKPVAFIGYGTYGAARAIEQIVNITAKIGMVPLSKTVVGIVKPWDAIQGDGTIKEEFVWGSLEKLTDNLLWWSKLLKQGYKLHNK